MTGILSIQRALGIDRDTFGNILDGPPMYLWMHDKNFTIVYANLAVKETFGSYQNQKCYQYLMGKKSVCSCCLFKIPLKNLNLERCRLCKRKNSGYDIDIFHVPIIDPKGQLFILKSNFHLKYTGIQTISK